MAIGKRGKPVRWSFGISARVSAPLVWSTIEAKCDEKFPATLRSAIEALLQDYNNWFDVGRAGWTYAELNKAAKKVESAIFEFREMVIDGKLLPDHPEGVGAAAVQFASRARQAADLVPVLKAASEVEILPEEADGRLDVLQELAARNKKILGLKPVDFRVALAETDIGTGGPSRKLLAPNTAPTGRPRWRPRQRPRGRQLPGGAWGGLGGEVCSALGRKRERGISLGRFDRSRRFGRTSAMRR